MLIQSLIGHADEVNIKVKTLCKFRSLDTSHKGLVDERLATGCGVTSFTEEKPGGGKKLSPYELLPLGAGSRERHFPLSFPSLGSCRKQRGDL